MEARTCAINKSGFTILTTNPANALVVESKWALKTKGACHPDCYTKGRGCLISNDGKCTFIFAKYGEPEANIKSNGGKQYLKQLDEYVRSTGKK